MSQLRMAALASILVWSAAALAQGPNPLSPLPSLTAGTTDKPPAPWQVLGFPDPNTTKPVTQFDVVTLDGARALRVRADNSYGNLVDEASGPIPGDLAWSWRLDKPLPQADIATRGGDDSALKVCVLFAEPLDRVPLLQRDINDILGAMAPEEVKVPTLFIRGGKSPYIPREDLPQIKEQFPNSRVETVPFAGHWVHAQAPDEVMALIRSVA